MSTAGGLAAELAPDTISVTSDSGLQSLIPSSNAHRDSDKKVESDAAGDRKVGEVELLKQFSIVAGEGNMFSLAAAASSPDSKEKEREEASTLSPV